MYTQSFTTDPTACKALYRCLDCREPFDYFKPFYCAACAASSATLSLGLDLPYSC